MSTNEMNEQKSQARHNMEYVQKMLDDYEQGMGLGKPEPACTEEQLAYYFRMDRTNIEGLSIQDCDEIMVKLAQTSLYLRRMYNIESSRARWAESSINNYVCDKLKEVGGQYDKFHIKVALIAKTDNYLSFLLKIDNYAHQRMARLYGLSGDVDNLKFTFLEVKKSKVKEQANG